MATQIPAIPDMGDRAVQMPGNVMDQEYYLFLSQLLKVVTEQAAQLEVLRAALNEARVNPTTVYSAVPAY